jgi:PAS domain S-box-containing protein
VDTGVRKQKSLVLIRAREVATNLAIPMVVLDAEGTIVFYNRSAEALFGRPFEEMGEMPSDQWAASFTPEEEDGTPIAMRELPAGVALTQRKPNHRSIHYTDTEGSRHEVEVTAFPLMGREGELYGAVTIVWQR